jgi:non-homologous end joining protein Ku
MASTSTRTATSSSRSAEAPTDAIDLEGDDHVRDGDHPGETRNAKRRKPEPKVIDLMEALKASVDKAKKGGAKPKARRPAQRKARRRTAA